MNNGFLPLVILVLLALHSTSCSSKPEEITALTNINLVPMTNEAVVENQTVLVEGARIAAVGATGVLSIPRGAEVIDGAGAYLMPGLADMHMHTRQAWDDREIWPVHPLKLYLASGVTTIRDFAPQGSPITYALKWRDEIRAGARDGPIIYASGRLLYASPLDDPEGMVGQNHDLGFDFLKLYSYLSPEDFHRAMAAAKGLGMYTSGHIPYAVGLDGVLRERMDEVAHVEELLFEFIDIEREQVLTPEDWLAHVVAAALAQWDLAAPSLQTDFQAAEAGTLESIADQLRSTDTPVCTTLVIDDVIQQKLFHLGDFIERPEHRYLPAAYEATLRRGEEKHQVQFRGIEDLAAFKHAIDLWILRGLHRDGVLLLLGTDAGTGGMGIVPGTSIHDELSILVENGFTPYEAIATGTVNAGIVIERMTGDGDCGTIEAGKRAELILVRGNPLEDVTTIREPLGVMAAGRWYDDQALADLSEPGR